MIKDAFLYFGKIKGKIKEKLKFLLFFFFQFRRITIFKIKILLRYRNFGNVLKPELNSQTCSIDRSLLLSPFSSKET